jgi:hypothetical protein
MATESRLWLFGQRDEGDIVQCPSAPEQNRVATFGVYFDGRYAACGDYAPTFGVTTGAARRACGRARGRGFTGRVWSAADGSSNLTAPLPSPPVNSG